MNNSSPILYTIMPGDTLYNYIYPYNDDATNDYWFSINQVNLLKLMIWFKKKFWLCLNFFVDGIVKQFPNLF